MMQVSISFFKSHVFYFVIKYELWAFLEKLCHGY